VGAPQVLVVGSLHYDVVVRAERLPALDETLPGRDVRYVFGGKGGNQALAAARHGASTAMAGAVGDDAPGRVLLETLDSAGVDRNAVAVLSGQASGMSVAIETGRGDYGAVIVSAANLLIGEVAVPAGTRIVVLQNEVPEHVNLAAARAARAAGATVLLNAAPARPTGSDLMDLVDVLVVNRVEAAALSGVDLATAAAGADAAVRLSAGTRTVIVTLGGDGAVFVAPHAQPVPEPARPVEVVSTHGAGDALVGALAARLAQGDGMAAALAYAQAAAALHVSADPAARAAIGPAATRQMMDR
jgi:ribokinase